MERKILQEQSSRRPKASVLDEDERKTEIRFWLRLGRAAERFSQDQCSVSILGKPSTVRHRRQ